MRDLPNRFFDVSRAAAMTVGYVGKDDAPIRELVSGLALLLLRSGLTIDEVEDLMVESANGVPLEYIEGTLPFADLN